MTTIHTDLVRRLREGDEAAWYELSRTFGPAIARAIGRFGSRRFTPETIRDLTQETLSEVARSIDRFDPDRGVRFSTWLLSIARFIVYGEVDRRMARKRGGGARPARLEEPDWVQGSGERPDASYERAIFRAKVFRALEAVGARRPLVEVEAYRMKIATRLLAKDIAQQLGVSEPSVSRYLTRVRDDLREGIRAVVAEYSFTDDERSEPARAGLDGGDEQLFDEAVSDIYFEEQALRMGAGGDEP